MVSWSDQFWTRSPSPRSFLRNRVLHFLMAIATINPATGQVVKTFEPLTDSQVEERVQLAATTFLTYRKVPFAERSRMMMKAAEILEREKDALGRLMTLEMGKPLK